MYRIILFFIFFLLACNSNKNNNDKSKVEEDNTANSSSEELQKENSVEADTIIVDSQYSFEEAINGSGAPRYILDQLELMDVIYISTDSKLHRGQVLTNKKLVDDLEEIFEVMLEHQFVVEKAIPIVAYNWSDSLSMADNNSYSFCYRNISYSLHAQGMAIDINPFFNPLRWKHQDLPNEPIGALLDTTINGTLHPEHLIVREFRKRGFRWGHTFSEYWDDHHFEKR